MLDFVKKAAQPKKAMPPGLFLFYVFDAEAHSAHLVFSKAYNLHFISQGQNILYPVDALFGDLGDVYHAFFSRSEFHKGTKFFDAYYGSF